MAQGFERRQHARQALVLQVSYPGQDEYFGDWTENLSVGGLFVRTDLPLAVGEKIDVELSFPHLLAPVDVSGVVAWVREASESAPRGIGLRVTGDQHRRRLAELALRLSEQRNASAERPTYAVLIVDDNPFSTRLYEAVLSRIDELSSGSLKVTIEDNGHRAFERFRRGERFELVISDAYMPIMDGFELAKSIRQLEGEVARTPIAIVARCTSGDERQQSKRAGADAFIEKPFRFADLLETAVFLLRSAHPPAATQPGATEPAL